MHHKGLRHQGRGALRGGQHSLQNAQALRNGLGVGVGGGGGGGSPCSTLASAGSGGAAAGSSVLPARCAQLLQPAAAHVHQRQAHQPPGVILELLQAGQVLHHQRGRGQHQSCQDAHARSAQLRGGGAHANHCIVQVQVSKGLLQVGKGGRGGGGRRG